MTYLELPDGCLHYRIDGDGPAIMMLHAGVADGRMWQRQVEAFGESYLVVRPDIRGFGESPLPDGEFSHVDDVVALADALGLARFWLVGASYGGLIALNLTLSHPERVAGLVLAAPAVSGMPSSAELEEFSREEDELYDAGKLEEASELNVRVWVDGLQRGPNVVDAAVRRQVYEMQLQAFRVPEPENVSLRRLDPPAYGRLAEIEAPTLVFSGALDLEDFVGLAEKLAAEIPQAKLIVLPDAGHLLSLEQPELFNRETLAFLNASV